MSLSTWRIDGFPEPNDLGTYPVEANGLPDPLLNYDGTVVATPAEFESRREEILEAAKFYQWGDVPTTPSVSASVAYDAVEWDGLGRLRGVDISLDGTPVTWRCLVATPTTTGPHPFFVVMTHLNLAPNLPPESGYPGAGGNNEYGTTAGDDVDWESALSRGYGVILFRHSDVCDDQTSGSLFNHYQKASNGGPYSWKALRAWGWLCERILDFATEDALLDETRAVVAGHSRRGKAALGTAMLDDRWAGCISIQSGSGGTGPWRNIGYSPHQTVNYINSNFSNWLRDRFDGFNSAPEKLPYDANVFVAAVAPRPVLVAMAAADQYSAEEAEYEVLRAAESAYNLLGADSALPASVPAVGSTTLGPLSFWLKAGTHSFNHDDWPAFLDFADAQVESVEPPDPDPPPTSGYLTFAPAPSEPLTFAPADAIDEPEAPSAAPTVTLTPASQTSLSMSLSEVDGATGYRYRVGTSGSWTDLGSGRTAQITSLTPGTSYTVQARAYNEAGDGPIGSATASTMALEVHASGESVSHTAAVGALARPIQLSAVSVTSTSATLQADASIRLAARATVTTSASAGLRRRVRTHSRAATYTSASADVLRAVRVVGSARAASAAYATLSVGDPLPHPTTLGVTIEDIYTLAAIIED